MSDGNLFIASSLCDICVINNVVVTNKYKVDIDAAEAIKWCNALNCRAIIIIGNSAHVWNININLLKKILKKLHNKGELREWGS